MTNSNTPPTLNCPQCGDTVIWNDDFPHRPFCSKRCKLMDFGEWANEQHKIPGEPANSQGLEEEGLEDEDY